MVSDLVCLCSAPTLTCWDQLECARAERVEPAMPLPPLPNCCIAMRVFANFVNRSPPTEFGRTGCEQAETRAKLSLKLKN